MNNLQKIIIMYLAKNFNSTGYEITVFLSDKTKHRHQQVYRELEKLESLGVISGVGVPQQGKPDKTVYKFIDCEDFDLGGMADFSKTDEACRATIREINGDKGAFDRYVAHMQAAEFEYLRKEGLIDELD